MYIGMRCCPAKVTFFLWLMGAGIVYGQHDAMQALRPRLDRLYAIAEREWLTLPLPEARPCVPDDFWNRVGDGTSMENALSEVALLRKNGAVKCAFRGLQLLQKAAAAKETDQLLWLRELSLTLIRAEKIDSAIATARRLSVLAERLHQFQGKAWFTEAKAWYEKRHFTDTYRLAEQSLAFARQEGDRRLEAKALELISDVSRDLYMTRPDKSVPPLLEALRISQDLRDSAAVVRGLASLSLHYMDKDLDKSLSYTEAAAAVPRFGNDPTNQIDLLRLLAFFAQMNRDFRRSNLFFERSVAYSKRLDLRSLVQNDCEQMSGNYIALGDANGAQACLDTAYAYCNFQRELGYFYHTFAEVATMRGDLPKAVEWYQKAFEEQVKGYNNRNTEQLTEWETRFRTREHELEEAEQKRLRWLWFWLALTLAGLFAGAVYAFFQQRKSRKQLAAQNALIENQSVELKRLDEAKSRFFANVSHELRTPLTLILGPLGAVLKTGRLDGRDAALVQTAQQHSRQLLGLVNEILDLSKMESGKMKLQETTVSLQPFLRRLVGAFESHAERLGIRFVFEYKAKERLRVLVDEDKLQKVLNNLLSNALKFTPSNQGGAITVQVEEVGNVIRLSVQDTGRGIHSDDLPHIFERFYQTSLTNAPVEGGTGIGLALCREFAEVMEGRIWVTSTLGEGSRFCFEFPKKEVLGVGAIESGTADPETEFAFEVLPPAQGLQKAAEGATTAGKTLPVVLVVEDNDSLRPYVKAVLDGQYRVLAAENGQQALDLLDAGSKVDLILSDVMMPVMDGFQLVEQLKKDKRYCHLPVVMLTARADLRDKLKALRTGVDDYLLKPFEEEELLARVANLLRNAAGRTNDHIPETEQHETGAKRADTAGAPGVSTEDLAWLSDLEKTVERALNKDVQFNTDALAEAMYMSRTKFFQQVKRLTGMTPNEYVLAVRFDKARVLLESRSPHSVKAVAGAVGFKDVEYFSKQFRARFGKVPSEYLN